VEGWKIGRLEDWKVGKVEGWKIGIMEKWRDGIIPTFQNKSVKRNMIINGVIKIELNGDSILPKQER
jgi:hypothetical protein